MTSPARSEDQLTASERAQLIAAHQRLKEAVEAYGPFLGGPLAGDKPVPTHDSAKAAAAQAAIESAEADLWRLRERLLGWKRPGWAPRAELVADWLSDEDAVYDDIKTADSNA